MAKLLLVTLFLPFIITGLVAAAYENCEQGKCNRAGRARRNVQAASCTDGAKTPTQVRDILESYKNNFNKNAFDAATMRNKSGFVGKARGLMLGVCKNLTVGGPPETASSVLAHLHVQRVACNNTASSLSDIPCNGCSQPAIAKYKIMSSFLAKSSEWNCSQNSDKCDGTCGGSLRMPDDLISNYSTKCLSQVINVQLYHPITNKPISVSVGSQPVMTVRIQFNNGSKNYQDSNFKCALWQDEVGTWNVTFCNLKIVPKKIGKDPYLADCNCTRFGSVCVVPSDAVFPSGSGGRGSSSGSEQTTSSPTAAGGNQTTTASSGGSNNGSSEGSSSNSSGSATTTASPNLSTTSSSGGNGSATTAASPNLSTTSSSGGNGSISEGSSSGGSSGGSGNDGSLKVSLTFDGDCKTIINTSKAGELIAKIKTLFQQEFDIKGNQIQDEMLICGSIIVMFTVTQLNSSNLDAIAKKIGSVTTSNDFVLTLTDGTKCVLSKALVGPSLGNLTSFYPSPATIPPTTIKRYELEFDYRPMMFTVALGILIVVLCVCCTCIVHSWWLRKDKFTEYNSMTAKEYEKKMKDKEDKYRMKEVEEVPMAVLGPSRKVGPTSFDMSNETMPKINERSFTNYDWAHTSYVVPANIMAQPNQDDEVDEPRLILDDDESDTDGEDNQGYVSDSGARTPTVPRAISHLSLDKEGLKPDSSDSVSNTAPPLYDNAIAEEGDENHIYESLDDMDPNGSAPQPPIEPQYCNVE